MKRAKHAHRAPGMLLKEPDVEEITRYLRTALQREYRDSNRKKNIGRSVILKRAEETSKIINDVFRKLRKETELTTPDRMFFKKKEQQENKKELFGN